MSILKKLHHVIEVTLKSSARIEIHYNIFVYIWGYERDQSSLLLFSRQMSKKSNNWYLWTSKRSWRTKTCGFGTKSSWGKN